MKKGASNHSRNLSDFQNIRAKIRVNMFVEEEKIKKVDDEGFGDVKEVDFEKDVEFGICDLDDKTEVAFEFGSIKIDKKKFREVLKRYNERNGYLKRLP